MQSKRSMEGSLLIWKNSENGAIDEGHTDQLQEGGIYVGLTYRLGIARNRHRYGLSSIEKRK